jgi:hypothetical protein
MHVAVGRARALFFYLWHFSNLQTIVRDVQAGEGERSEHGKVIFIENLREIFIRFAFPVIWACTANRTGPVSKEQSVNQVENLRTVIT